jgi:hypothetical protein
MKFQIGDCFSRLSGACHCRSAALEWRFGRRYARLGKALPARSPFAPALASFPAEE